MCVGGVYLSKLSLYSKKLKFLCLYCIVIFFTGQENKSTAMIIIIVDYVLQYLCPYGDNFKGINMKENDSLKFHNRMP